MPGALTRSDPFAELGEPPSQVERMLDESLDDRERACTPALDVGRLADYRTMDSVVRHPSAAVLDGWTGAAHDRY